MSIYSKLLGGGVAIAGASALFAFAPVALADETNFQPFAEEFTEAATRVSGDSFEATSFLGQLTTIFGIAFPWPGNINAFPESNIASDANSFNQVHREAMLKQTVTDPFIRTPDLINPFNTSILSQPNFINPALPAPRQVQ
ncbi:MAG: hypothetical protein HC835_12975 [Oscillatoriales cyanobacterium RM2_1_1]|nr:hypothetical protein [Oscillatoriales cyanobacterium SM2_3_0]NJO46461.1 hypothetical protein [Oscillatoriales cyanobacterium RM2_1_1]